jgi:DNA-binding NtrC family response regulator
MPRKRWDKGAATRPVLYQLCRAGERFEVGDGPADLTHVKSMVVGRGDPSRTKPTTQHLPVDDPWMSSRHARIYSEGGKYLIEDLGSTNGVLIAGEAVTRAELKPGDLIETGRTFWTFEHEPRAIPLPDEPYEFGTWSTWSPRLAKQLTDLNNEIASGRHMLLAGPEGTGKGFLARTTHLLSGRRGRLVHLDCSERRPKRLIVDLFGGPGQTARLKEADLGTLFLENVDGLPVSLQERLVKAVKRGGFTPEGRHKRVTMEVRVIASTRSDVEGAIASGALAPSLVELLSQITIFLPGLDERRADLGLLLDDFLARARGAPAINREACRAVLRHPWKHQIKALSRVIEAAATLASDFDDGGRVVGTIELVHLPVEVVGEGQLKELIPAGAQEQRPPSMQSPIGFDEPGDYTGTDPDRTDEGHSVDEGVSDGFSRAVADVEDMVAGFEALEPTDPAQLAQQSLPRPRLASSDVPERPPSAYHDMDSIERSYASAVDPDLIVEALRRSRGNVSAAARYLGKPRALLLRWMREFQINSERYRE